MILFVFEGNVAEPALFEALESVFFSEHEAEERMIYQYKANIYSLYSHMKQLGEGADLVDCIHQHCKDQKDPIMTMRSEDFAEIFLFFDYDFHHHPSDKSINLADNIRKVEELLHYFDNETERGRLYIDYPMIESVNYTRQLPDAKYYRYTVTLTQSRDFKKLMRGFSYYGDDYKHLSVAEVGEKTATELWKYLIYQNVEKANYICTGSLSLPTDKTSIESLKLWSSQRAKYGDRMIGILNAFPLFLFDYMDIQQLNLSGVSMKRGLCDKIRVVMSGWMRVIRITN